MGYLRSLQDTEDKQPFHQEELRKPRYPDRDTTGSRSLCRPGHCRNSRQHTSHSYPQKCYDHRYTAL